MKSICGGIALLTIVALIAPLTGADPAGFAPDAGVLLLRNGHVIQGQVTKAGDFYVVTLGDSGELRIPAADAECTAASLTALYEAKTQQLDGRISSHLDLADWCLRQRQPAWATQQWLAASKIDPENPRVKMMERRLSSLAEETTQRATTQAAKPAIDAEQIDASLKQLSPLAIERYATVIQPMVLNRCAANQCHGSASKTELALVRPAPGQPLIKRFTDRNLHALLKFVDTQKPADSPLLIMAQRRHGGMISPVFDKRSQTQVKELREWIDLASGVQPRTTPAVIPSAESMANTTMRTVHDGLPAEGDVVPAVATQSIESQDSIPEDPQAADSHPIPQREGKKGAQSASTTKATAPSKDNPHSAAEILNRGKKEKPKGPGDKTPFVPKDPFDPEIFNRRYHGDGKTSSAPAPSSRG